MTVDMNNDPEKDVSLDIFMDNNSEMIKEIKHAIQPIAIMQGRFRGEVSIDILNESCRHDSVEVMAEQKRLLDFYNSVISKRIVLQTITHQGPGMMGEKFASYTYNPDNSVNADNTYRITKQARAKLAQDIMEERERLFPKLRSDFAHFFEDAYTLESYLKNNCMVLLYSWKYLSNEENPQEMYYTCEISVINMHEDMEPIIRILHASKIIKNVETKYDGMLSVFECIDQYVRNIKANHENGSLSDSLIEMLLDILKGEPCKFLSKHEIVEDFFMSTGSLNYRKALEYKVMGIIQSYMGNISVDIQTLVSKCQLFIDGNSLNYSPDWDILGNEYWETNAFLDYAQRMVIPCDLTTLHEVCFRMKCHGHTKVFLKHTAPKNGVWIINLDGVENSLDMHRRIIDTIGTMAFQTAISHSAFIVQPFIDFRNEMRVFVVGGKIIKAVPVRRADTVFEDDGKIVSDFICKKHDGHNRIYNPDKTQAYIEFVEKMLENQTYNAVIDIGEDGDGNIYPIEFNTLLRAGRYGYKGSDLCHALIQSRDEYISKWLFSFF